ncbi:MAG: hypothetical protein OEM22_06355 [Acidimicrobiia bacterium]|nr:hypothetical protein [Acidimicrobiia bacterium]MDH3470963.1 hypothetical protein [Acidimicrobiia bacterium]
MARYLAALLVLVAACTGSSTVTSTPPPSTAPPLPTTIAATTTSTTLGPLDVSPAPLTSFDYTVTETTSLGPFETPIEVAVTITGAFREPPFSHRITREVSLEGLSTVVGEAVVIDDEVWVRMGDEWEQADLGAALGVAGPINQIEGNLLPSDAVLQSLFRQTGVVEEFNGLRTRRYEFESPADIPLPVPLAEEDAQLTYWIDEDTGYVVQWQVVARGTLLADAATSVPVGELVQLEVLVQISNHNQPITISPPP